MFQPRWMSVRATMSAWRRQWQVAAVLNPVEHLGPNTRAVILVDRSGDTLTVSVEVEGAVGTVVAADLVDVAARVGALGGRFTTVETATGAAVVTAVIPCGS
jgi:hypothetical protein